MKSNLSEKGKVKSEKGKAKSEKEKIKGNGFGQKMLFIWIVVMNLICSSWIFAYSQTKIQYERLSDGVEHWYRIKSATDKPWFFQQLENIFEVVLSRPDKLPFGKSVAFLAGVSRYQYLKPKLPFVENDLEDMRKFLLEKGGFDEVYLAKNEKVNRDLIEEYIQNKFFPASGISSPLKLSKEDRFLFYYSGHGGDRGGESGYMQFSNAEPGKFGGDQVLPMKIFQTWCSEIKIDHLLIIFDCCNSGLGFEPIVRSNKSYEQLIATLSKGGSRTIITAGTANEKTFEVKDKQGRGNGVFTRAFLNALETGRADDSRDGFMIIDEIMGRVKSEIAEFSSIYNQSVTPRAWPLYVNSYPGTFVFINPIADRQQISLNKEILEITGAKSAQGIPVAEFGYLHLKAHESGSVYIDNAYADNIETGEIKKYERSVGRHKIELKTASKIYAENVDILKGKTLQVALGLVPITPIRPPEMQTVVSQIFRPTPKTLSYADVKTMLQQYDFYCKEYDWNKQYSNPSGRGFANQFESKTIQGDKIVIDNASGLMWQQSGSLEYMTYEKAQQWIKDLNKNGYAGYTNWRLPTLEEAMSLMESKPMNGDLYIDQKFDRMQSWIWTSDPYSGAAGAQWVVGFNRGGCFYDYLYDIYVRAVRFGQSSP